jgi:hypothetical protein
MKATFLVTTLVTAALPFAMLRAEDPTESNPQPEGQTETSGETDMQCMRGINTAEIIILWKNQDTELQQLLTEVNQAPADKKADATAALVSKLVQQQTAFHEKVRDLVNADARGGKEMCCGMMETDN